MKKNDYLKAEFPSLSVNEGFARSCAACFLARLDPTLDELNDVKTAVSEAVTNCIVHAYPGTVGPILLRCRLVGENEAEITVKDKGVGIEDVAKAREPLYTSGDPAERAGMGFTIMESFSDKLTVRSRAGKGTSVTLRKRFRGRQSYDRRR